MFFPQRVKGRFVPSIQNSTKILLFLWGMTFFGSGVVWGDQAWKDVSSKEDQFSVSMPAEPKFQTETFKTALGPIKAHEWIVEMDGGKAAFLIGVNQYPPSHVAKVGSAVLLENVQKGQLGSDGKLRSQKNIQVGAIPGVKRCTKNKKLFISFASSWSRRASIN